MTEFLVTHSEVNIFRIDKKYGRGEIKKYAKINGYVFETNAGMVAPSEQIIKIRSGNLKVIVEAKII